MAFYQLVFASFSIRFAILYSTNDCACRVLYGRVMQNSAQFIFEHGIQGKCTILFGTEGVAKFLSSNPPSEAELTRLEMPACSLIEPFENH